MPPATGDGAPPSGAVHPTSRPKTQLHDAGAAAAAALHHVLRTAGEKEGGALHHVLRTAGEKEGGAQFDDVVAEVERVMGSCGDDAARVLLRTLLPESAEAVAEPPPPGGWGAAQLLRLRLVNHFLPQLAQRPNFVSLAAGALDDLPGE
eukprot:gene30500-13527_t